MKELADPAVLCDERIELRPWRDDDAGAVAAAREEAYSDALEWVARQQARPLSVGVSRAIARPGQPAVGYVGLIRRPRLELGARAGADYELVFSAHQRNVGIGYWVAPTARAAGCAARAARLLSKWALRYGGVNRVEALVDPDNVASRRVAEKSGFQPEGRVRHYLELEQGHRDALFYSLLSSDL